MFFIFVQVKNKYWSYLPIAYKIYETLYGQPKSHGEWANGFNIRGKIIKTLIENDSQRNL